MSSTDIRRQNATSVLMATSLLYIFLPILTVASKNLEKASQFYQLNSKFVFLFLMIINNLLVR